MGSFYELILKSADGAFIVNSRKRITLWNRQARQILGYSAREALGVHCYQLLAGREPSGRPICCESCRTLKTAVRRGQVKSFNMVTRKKGGQEVELNVSIIVVPGRDAKPKALVHLFREVAPAHREAKVPYHDRTADSTCWPPLLSDREREVLGLMAQGTDTRTIADLLFISWATARNHIRNILQKLGVHGKLEAVVYAYRHRLI